MCHPIGDISKKQVGEANKMVSNLVLLLYLLTARGAWWIVEQPARSLLEEHPRWAAMVKKIPVFRTHVWMSDFNAATAQFAQHKEMMRGVMVEG